MRDLCDNHRKKRKKTSEKTILSFTWHKNYCFQERTVPPLGKKALEHDQYLDRGSGKSRHKLREPYYIIQKEKKMGRLLKELRRDSEPFNCGLILDSWSCTEGLLSCRLYHHDPLQSRSSMISCWRFDKQFELWGSSGVPRSSSKSTSSPASVALPYYRPSIEKLSHLGLLPSGRSGDDVVVVTVVLVYFLKVESDEDVVRPASLAKKTTI